DTGPLLGSSSATELIPTVDAVALVARSGRTRPSAARRTVEMLSRLDAPVLGVVLMGVERPLHKNSYHYYARPPAAPGAGSADDAAPRAALTPLAPVPRADEADEADEDGGGKPADEAERRWLDFPRRGSAGGHEAARWSR
ncbi:MAG TPA: hypothetical protein VFO65_01115, partial [Acidimicrobiales bacterium]|nr:hypothetical protein [Acidimicrobiales bacterium]